MKRILLIFILAASLVVAVTPDYYDSFQSNDVQSMLDNPDDFQNYLKEEYKFEGEFDFGDYDVKTLKENGYDFDLPTISVGGNPELDLGQMGDAKIGLKDGKIFINGNQVPKSTNVDSEGNDLSEISNPANYRVENGNLVIEIPNAQDGVSASVDFPGKGKLTAGTAHYEGDDLFIDPSQDVGFIMSKCLVNRIENPLVVNPSDISSIPAGYDFIKDDSGSIKIYSQGDLFLKQGDTWLQTRGDNLGYWIDPSNPLFLTDKTPTIFQTYAKDDGSFELSRTYGTKGNSIIELDAHNDGVPSRIVTSGPRSETWIEYTRRAGSAAFSRAYDNAKNWAYQQKESWKADAIDTYYKTKDAVESGVEGASLWMSTKWQEFKDSF